jgi:hypothetical protein
MIRERLFDHLLGRVPEPVLVSLLEAQWPGILTDEELAGHALHGVGSGQVDAVPTCSQRNNWTPSAISHTPSPPTSPLHTTLLTSQPQATDATQRQPGGVSIVRTTRMSARSEGVGELGEQFCAGFGFGEHELDS